MGRELPLEGVLKRHRRDISFHTPAHNGGILNYALGVAEYDVTELSYSDNLLSPDGVIAESEAMVADVYGSDRVVYSTAGATALIHTAIYAYAESGSFLVYGEAHKSVYNALRRAGAKCYVYRGDNLAKALEDSGAATLIITSPDYYGRTLDLSKIKSTVEHRGVKVIVDASHGSHFAFSSKLPQSATEYFSTVIHSLHKTLPVLTGGAIMHIAEKDYAAVMRAFREVHTTSPSYPVMASIESAVDMMAKEGERLYSEVIAKIEAFAKEIAELPLEVVPTDDPTRVVIRALSYSAVAVAEELEAKGIYPECYDYDKVTLIVTPFNADKLTSVIEALRTMDYSGDKPEPYDRVKSEGLTELTFGSGYEAVDIKEAAGRILYEGIGVYPPGTPIALPGERLDCNKCAAIEELYARGDLSLFGLEKGTVLVLKY